jgi:hypothetical protein
VTGREEGNAPDRLFRDFALRSSSFCQKSKREVFTVEFSDNSFDGSLCLPDLKNAVRYKVGPSKNGTSDTPERSKADRP